MSALRLILRNLVYYRSTTMMAMMGTAVASAVIVGSLAMGTSLRESLRESALSRLGSIHYSMRAPTFFRAELVQALKRDAVNTNALITTSGKIENAEGDQVIPDAQVIGVDDTFWTIYPGTHRRLGDRDAAVNKVTASELGVGVGDSIIVTIDKHSSVPSAILFAHRSTDRTLVSLRLRVAAVLPDSGPGGFKLNADSEMSRNLFVSREALASALSKDGLCNTLVVVVRVGDKAVSPSALDEALRRHCNLSDYGLRLQTSLADGSQVLESDGLVLNEHVLCAARRAAAGLDLKPTTVSVYLASRIRDMRTGMEMSYGVVAGLDQFGSLDLSVPLSGKAVILNDWAARDIEAIVGDPIQISYLVPQPDGSYIERSKNFVLGGTTSISGLAADSSLVPVFEGITGADRIDQWGTPFPIDMSRVSKRDELYWDIYRTAPKAFLPLDALRTMWASGESGIKQPWVTSIRFTSPAVRASDLASKLEKGIRRGLDPAWSGLVFAPTRALALSATQGSTDFAGLFLGLSIFIIASGVGLSLTLLQLGVEQRASQAGIMLACGFQSGRVKSLLTAEGAILAAVGAITGLPLGVLFAKGIMLGLGSVWSGSVGVAHLQLHIFWPDMLMGAILSFVLGSIAALLAAGRIRHAPALDLLSGGQSIRVQSQSPTHKQAHLWVAIISGTLGVVSAVLGVLGVTSAEEASFTTGSLLLVAGLAGAAFLLTQAMTLRFEATSTLTLALRSAASNRMRSLLVVALTAAASFILLIVAANNRSVGSKSVFSRDSGAGGYALRVTTTAPLRYDLDSPKGRENLGFTSADEEIIKRTQMCTLLRSAGDDVSCLNLARPTVPKLLGVSRSFVERGGFTIRTSGVKIGWQSLELPEPDGAIPTFGDADSVIWNLKSGLGKVINVTAQDGSTVRLRIRGLIPQSIFAGELVISEKNFHRLYPSITYPSYFLVETRPEEVDVVARVLRSGLARIGPQVRTTSELLNSFASVQNTYISMFLALGGFGLVLGTLGVAIVLLRNAYERRAEFALMSAVGFTKPDLAQLLIVEHFGLLALGLFIGAVAALVGIMPQLLDSTARADYPTTVIVIIAMTIVGMTTCILAALTAVDQNPTIALRGE